MRGKLRDKHATSKRDNFNQEDLEQRRPYKRDARTSIWSTDQENEDDEFIIEDDENTPEKVELPKKK